MTVSWLSLDCLMTQTKLSLIWWAMGQCRVGPCLFYYIISNHISYQITICTFKVKHALSTLYKTDCCTLYNTICTPCAIHTAHLYTTHSTPWIIRSCWKDAQTWFLTKYSKGYEPQKLTETFRHWHEHCNIVWTFIWTSGYFGNQGLRHLGCF